MVRLPHDHRRRALHDVSIRSVRSRTYPAAAERAFGKALGKPRLPRLGPRDRRRQDDTGRQPDWPRRPVRHRHAHGQGEMELPACVQQWNGIRIDGPCRFWRRGHHSLCRSLSGRGGGGLARNGKRTLARSGPCPACCGRHSGRFGLCSRQDRPILRAGCPHRP